MKQHRRLQPVPDFRSFSILAGDSQRHHRDYAGVWALPVSSSPSEDRQTVPLVLSQFFSYFKTTCPAAAVY
jgi:hypothetical protein